AAARGAVGHLGDAAAGPGGARLVYVADRRSGGEPKEPLQPPLDEEGVVHWRAVLRECAEESSGAVFVARVGPDCDRCPVRTSCPVHGSGRAVTEP
ncbi:MAG: PD-(D/E)XK nuclease family protein, partial [Pseudonocardia sp.]|nr:PD-(D/E)XK nuclease family protein [Pseudonocardia sp.]